MTLEEIGSLIVDVPDFPKPGIVFKDITPLLADPPAFTSTIGHLAERMPANVDALLAIESRGFVFGAALAERLSVPLQLVRKRGKLPREAMLAGSADARASRSVSFLYPRNPAYP